MRMFTMSLKNVGENDIPTHKLVAITTAGVPANAWCVLWFYSIVP